MAMMSVSQRTGLAAYSPVDTETGLQSAGGVIKPHPAIS